ncbi:MAG: RHS repeat-associated core domain-containing protein, partial [Acidobacteriota bacterium]
GQPPYQVQSARVDYVYAGGKMVYSRQRTSSTGAWSERYYLSDRLSTRVVLDGLGNVIGRQAHLPFGEDFAESGSQEKHHFTSYEWDGEAGTDYAVNRQYSQSNGRFNRPDPLASSGKKEAPQSWNRYAYAASDPINMKDTLGLFLSPTGDWDDPCGLYGPIPIEDSWWNTAFDFSSIFCFAPILLPRPEPDPEPAPTPCSINIRTGGPKQSSIDTRSDINSVNFDELGPYQHPVPDGWWFLIFEVQVFLGTAGRDGWRFNQSVVRNSDLLVDLGGILTPVQNHFEDSNDRMIAENPLHSQLVGSIYYWIDEPARRKVHEFGGGLPQSPVVAGQVIWDFVMTATNTKDPRRSCSKRLRLKLTIGSKAKWKATS